MSSLPSKGFTGRASQTKQTKALSSLKRSLSLPCIRTTNLSKTPIDKFGKLYAEIPKLTTPMKKSTFFGIHMHDIEDRWESEDDSLVKTNFLDSDSSSEERDYTACDMDSCGYCGHCIY